MYKELQKISLTGTGARMYARQCTLQGGWRLFAASVKAAQFRQPPFRVLPTGSKQGAHAALLSQSSTAPQPTGSKQRARAAILLLFRFVFPAMISSATFVSTIRAKRLKAAYGRFAFKVGSPASMRPHFESRLFIPPYRWYSLRLRDWRKTLRSTTSAKQHCAPAYGLQTEGARCYPALIPLRVSRHDLFRYFRFNDKGEKAQSRLRPLCFQGGVSCKHETPFRKPPFYSPLSLVLSSLARLAENTSLHYERKAALRPSLRGALAAIKAARRGTMPPPLRGFAPLGTPLPLVLRDPLPLVFIWRGRMAYFE